MCVRAHTRVHVCVYVYGPVCIARAYVYESRVCVELCVG